VLLKFVVFGGGAVLMALEILAFRIIGKTFGTALRETSAVIAVFLAAMSLGYYLGGKWGDRWPRPTTLLAALGLGGGFLELIPHLEAPLAEWVFHSALPLSTHALVVSVLLFFVPAMLLASVSPITIRLLSREVAASGKVAGTVAAISTVGSILGTLATGFYLIDLFQHIHHILHALAGTLALLLGLLFLHPRRSP